MDYKTLLLIIPPAIALAVISFLVKFLGKIIVDQKPFSDDRNWDLELNGIGFLMNNLVINIAIGVVLAIKFPLPYSNLWGFVILSFIISIFAIVSMTLTSRAYDIEIPLFKILGLSKKDIQGSLVKTSNFILWLLPAGFYFITLEFMTKDIFWSVLTACQLFLILFYSAFIYSLRIYKPIKADIYFIDSTQAPLIGVNLLKINPDNIRLKDGKNVMILNKNTVARIVEKPSKGVKKQSNKIIVK